VSVQPGIYDGNHIGIDSTGPVTKDAKLLYRVVFGWQYAEAITTAPTCTA